MFIINTKALLFKINVNDPLVFVIYDTPEVFIVNINPLNTQLNSICHLLALLGAHHILYISRVTVNAVSVHN